MHEEIRFHAERADARFLLRWAAQILSPKERAAVEGWLAEEILAETAIRIRVSRQRVQQLRELAFVKMKRRLRSAGITCSSQVLSEPPAAPPELAA